MTVRRLPWVTFGVMILCAVTFLLSGRGHLFVEDDVRLSEHVYEALEYYIEHPYLDLDPEFEQIALPAGRDELTEYLEEASIPPGEFIRLDRQHKLDELMALAVNSYDLHPLMRWGLIPSDMRPVTLVTHMFLHAGWLHLIGNMLILYLAGPFIEDVWGRPLYLTFYLVAGLGAALCHAASGPDSAVPMIGASGAIAGIMGAFLVRYRTTRIRFFYIFGLFWRGTFSAPAWTMLPLWFSEQLFMAMLTSKADDAGGAGVAHWAHVGGFVIGIAVAMFIASQRIEERILDPAIADKISTPVVHNAAVEQALEAHAAGDGERALDLLRRRLDQNPSHLDAAAALWQVALEQDRGADVSAVVLRAIQHGLRSGHSEWALDQWSELLAGVPDVEAEAGMLVRLAQALERHERHDEARVTLRRALLAAGSGVEAAMALKIARVAEDLDQQVARAAARMALMHRELDPAARAEAEALVSRLEPATVSLDS